MAFLAPSRHLCARPVPPLYIRACVFIYPGGKSDLRYKIYECPRHGVGRGRQIKGRNTVGLKRLSIAEIVKLENLSFSASIRLSIVEFAHRFHFFF